MTLATLTKDPNERLDYDIDFSRWLPAADSIASATATISGGTAVIDLTQPSSTGVRVWINGGLDGQTNTVVVRATTAQGRIKEASFRLKIKEMS